MEVKAWLEDARAAGLMTREIVALRPTDLLAAAAELLLREQISGAPVVDDAGVCVGVISAGDFLGAEEKAERAREEIAESPMFHSQLALPSSVYAERLTQVRDKLVPAAQQPVSRFMTTDVVSVGQETSLKTVVQHMVDAHVHRVLVLEADRKLVGLITTTDVLAALLRAAA